MSSMEYCRLVLFVLLALCSGCTYHLGQGELSERYHSIYVPYVKGDLEGTFTASVIRKIAESGAFEYRNGDADLILNIILTDFDEENVGFRYDRKRKGELTKAIIPVETRLTVYAQVTLIDSCTCCPVMGPVELSADIEFDHDYYSSGINSFSFGQLNDLDTAMDIARRPLGDVLAQKIVDYLTLSW